MDTTLVAIRNRQPEAERKLYLSDVPSENALLLLAAVFRQAVHDAEHGKPDAIQFLDDELPTWRRYTGN